MSIPKAIRSLKSYFIRTTSHLCNVGGQRPCSNTIVPCHYGNISHINVQLLFWYQALIVLLLFPCASDLYYKHSAQNCAQFLPNSAKYKMPHSIDFSALVIIGFYSPQMENSPSIVIHRSSYQPILLLKLF